MKAFSHIRGILTLRNSDFFHSNQYIKPHTDDLPLKRGPIWKGVREKGKAYKKKPHTFPETARKPSAWRNLTFSVVRAHFVHRRTDTDA